MDPGFHRLGLFDLCGRRFMLILAPDPEAPRQYATVFWCSEMTSVITVMPMADNKTDVRLLGADVTSNEKGIAMRQAEAK